MSSAAASTPQQHHQYHVSPRDIKSPSNGAGDKLLDDYDGWSGEEDEDEEDGAASRGVKRQRTGRPISVSCEKCKERKVCLLPQCTLAGREAHAVNIGEV